MVKLRDCIVCHVPLESGQGEPCAICGDWFHFEIKRYPAYQGCGVMSDRIPGLVA